MNHHPHNAHLRRYRQTAPALITACTINREPLLRGEACAQTVLDSLCWLDARQRLILYAAVVMPDHIHFVADPLGTAWALHVHALKSHTGPVVNRHLGRSGQVWQRQYHDRQVHSDHDLIKAIGYCEHNPRRAGLVPVSGVYPHLWLRFNAPSAREAESDF